MNDCATCKHDNSGANRKYPHESVCLHHKSSTDEFWATPECPGYERRNE